MDCHNIFRLCSALVALMAIGATASPSLARDGTVGLTSTATTTISLTIPERFNALVSKQAPVSKAVSGISTYETGLSDRLCIRSNTDTSEYAMKMFGAGPGGSFVLSNENRTSPVVVPYAVSLRAPGTRASKQISSGVPQEFKAAGTQEQSCLGATDLQIEVQRGRVSKAVTLKGSLLIMLSPAT